MGSALYKKMFRHAPGEEYVPTEEEIAKACKELQAGWSPAERVRRLKGLINEDVIKREMAIKDQPDVRPTYHIGRTKHGLFIERVY